MAYETEKENAAPTYKKGFGFHPLMAYLDATALLYCSIGGRVCGR